MTNNAESSAAPPDRSDLSGLARGGTLNLLGAACNQLCLFAVIAVVARGVGGRAVGEYTLCWAFLIVAGFLALWGFQATLNRFVAIYLATGDAARVRGVIRLGVFTAVGISVALAVVITAFSRQLADLFGNRDLGGQFRLVALTLPGATLRDVVLAATQGWRTQKPFALIGWIYEPVVRLVLTGVAVAMGAGSTGVFAVIPIGAWSAAVLAVIGLRRLMRGVPDVPPAADVGNTLRFAMASWGTVISSVGLIWADTLILGILGGTTEVGVYNVATRIVNLAVFVMVPLNAALAPQLAHLLHRGDRGALEHAYRSTTRWMVTLSLPAFVVLVVFPNNLLRLFGEEYVAGAAVTLILAAGQFFNTTTGPCGNLLNMSGHVRLNTVNNIVTLILNIGLNIVLIPRFGIGGAAFAWAVSLAVVNLARVFESRHFFAIVPFDRSTAKPLLAACVAGAVAVAVRIMLPSSVVALCVGAAVVAIAYVGTLVVLGFEQDDRAAIRSVVGRAKSQTQSHSEGAAR